MESSFELFQKLGLQIYASQFMASEVIPLKFVLFNLESVERKGKITKKNREGNFNFPMCIISVSQSSAQTIGKFEQIGKITIYVISQG